MTANSFPKECKLHSDSGRGFGQKDKAKGKELWNILKAKAIL